MVDWVTYSPFPYLSESILNSKKYAFASSSCLRYCQRRKKLTLTLNGNIFDCCGPILMVQSAKEQYNTLSLDFLEYSDVRDKTYQKTSGLDPSNLCDECVQTLIELVIFFYRQVGPFTISDNNNKYAITLQCNLTKYVIIIPIVNKEAIIVAQGLVDDFFLTYGPIFFYNIFIRVNRLHRFL